MYCVTLRFLGTDMASAVSRLRPIVSQPSGKHTASLVFLHGSGDTGHGIMTWIGGLVDFTFNQIKVIYPTAPLRPYTASMGMMSSIWFDRKQISPFASENRQSMEETCEALSELIDTEVARGIPRSRIMLGGFSMGGSMALYYGLLHGKDLAGLFALSSFLDEKSLVYEHLKVQQEQQQQLLQTPAVYQCHGSSDPLVLESWGRNTHEKLKSLGVQCSYASYPGVFHEPCEAGLEKLVEFVTEKLPDV